MAKDMENVFRIGVELAGDFFGSFAPKLGTVFDSLLQFENARRRFFTGFNARLVIGVDVDQTCVKPDRAFVESDQGANLKSRYLRDGERDRFPAAFIQRRPGAAQKSLHI